MDMRYEMRDGRRLPPRNSRGEFRRRRSRRDRGMDYGSYEDMRRGNRGGDYGNYDMRGEMRGMGGMDGHHYPMQGHEGQGSTYYPIQAMGTFEGYYGMPEQDYARGDMRYDMRGGRGGRDYGYPMYDMRGGYGRDYGYDDYGYPVGDYGESLSEQELDKWCEKMKKNFSEQEKQIFSEQAILQKAKQMGIKMDGFTEKELYVNTIRNYTDHKKSIGANPDLALKMAYDDFHDEDGKYQGSEWLSVYYDDFVQGGKED